MSLAILGLGTALPSTSVSQAEAIGIARSLCSRTEEQATWLPSVYGGSGIERRHYAFSQELVNDILHGTTHTGSIFLPTGRPDDAGPSTAQRMQFYAKQAGPLASEASLQALRRSGLQPRDLTHLITVSCTGFAAPGFDISLIQTLGLNPTIERTHVGFMGCHGALNGLRVARSFAGSEPEARVLLCATELCGPHYHYGWDPQKVIANALFADGAAAIVGASPINAPAAAWLAKGSASCLIPNSTSAMTWKIGDHGFEMTLSKQVPTLIAKHLRPWLETWLVKFDLTLEQIPSWAIHPGGPRILSAVEETLSLSREVMAPSRAVLAECGNMSSPTLLFILDRLRNQQAPRPCVALGFGPGLNAEAALFG